MLEFVVSLAVAAASFALSYKIVARWALTDDEMTSAAWQFFVITMIVNAALSHYGLGLISMVVFFVLAWKLLNIRIIDAIILSLLWSAFNFGMMWVFFGVRPKS